MERPGGGDVFRSFRGGNYSAHFCAYNRNKRSVVLDLKSDLGCKLALDLVRRSDIMIVNFRPGVMDRLKLSYSKRSSRPTPISSTAQSPASATPDLIRSAPATTP